MSFCGDIRRKPPLAIQFLIGLRCSRTPRWLLLPCIYSYSQYSIKSAWRNFRFYRKTCHLIYKINYCAVDNLSPAGIIRDIQPLEVSHLKLSSAIIHYELQRSYPLGPCSCAGTKLSLKRPLLWNGERSAERNRVYILAAPAFPEEYSASNLFVFCGEAPESMPRCDYICFTVPQVVEQVLNDLQMIFDRYLGVGRPLWRRCACRAPRRRSWSAALRCLKTCWSLRTWASA